MTDEHHMQHGPMSRGQILDYEFDEFLEANPHIYERFRLLAVKLKARGIERWGAKAIWEVMRYEMAMETNAPAGGPMLNNNHVSRMARKLMAEEPDDFAGFFELRKLKSNA